MSLLFGPRANQPNKLGSIQVQTSEYGVPIPYAAGTVKMPMKLLDYQDFTANAQTSGKGGQLTGYDYRAAIDAALCLGPIQGFGNIFTATGTSGLVASVETYTIPSGGGTYTSYYNTTEEDEGVTTQATYSFTANDFGSDGEQTITGTQYVPMQKVTSGSPLGANEYSVVQDNNVTSTTQGVINGSGGNLHYSFSAADAGKTVTITYSYTNNATNYVSPAAQYNLVPFLGTQGGTVWGYMQTNHPANAISYPGIARAAAQDFDLGTDASPPNVSIEVINARGLAFGSGVSDCDPAALITDICTAPVAGMNWNYLADLGVSGNNPASFSSFCVANNLFMSLGYDSTRKALDCLKEIIQLANSEAVWTGGQLNVVPYGDTTAVANGRTFTPATQPVDSIDYNDLIAKQGEEPILTSWKGLADNYNQLQFQYTLRSDNYNTAVINAMDEAAILMNGPLPMKTITGDNYRVAEYAAVAANMLLKRNCVALRNYSFNLRWWKFRLMPMDIVTLTTKGGRAVRIVSIKENDDYSLSVVAEDFLYGVGSGTLYAQQANSGTTSSANNQPGATSMLAAFQPVTRITGGTSQLWIALTGGSSWGGCDVYLSTDGGSTYGFIGTQEGSARAGTLTAAFAEGSDPDTSDTLAVSIDGTITSATQASADSYATLAQVGTELIAYSVATLTGSANGQNQYSLGTYIRRGVFSTGSQAHASGDKFVILDSQIFKYTLDPSLLGKTVYLKFLSFNLLSNQMQSLGDVTAVEVGLTQTPSATTMTVSAAKVTSGSTSTATISVYDGTIGTAGTATLDNGTTVALPAYQWTGEMLGTWYGVNYDTAGAAYALFTDENQWLAAQSTQIAIGSLTTPT